MSGFDGTDNFSSLRALLSTPEVVLAAFADAEKLARWWGPSGFLSTFHVFDFRSGGRWSLVMQGPHGKHYPNTVSFEVVEPRRRAPPLGARLPANDHGPHRADLGAAIRPPEDGWGLAHIAGRRMNRPRSARGSAHFALSERLS